jgi:digeranylgeranylglycerophospholipid reductase
LVEEESQMVTVDPYRCAYCGGCVSVCPMGALTLAETRLLVGADCIECGDCITVCPTGALQPEDARGAALSAGQAVAAASRPRRRYDVVVAGAGPGGAVAAATAAGAGLSVLLLEKRQEIGSPVRCAEGIGRDQLLPFIEPDPRWISAEVTRAEITAAAGDQVRTLCLEGGQGYVLERRIFDRALAERAARAGAEVRVKTAVSGLLVENGCVQGVKLRPAHLYAPALAGDEVVEVEANIVIAADGIEAQVGRWAGLDVQLPPGDTMVCLQYLLAGVDTDPECTAYTIDYGLAPGGYAWVFPKGNGRANVGLGVQADLWQAVAARQASAALGFLTRFIESRPELARGYPVCLIAGNVPVALSPRRLTAAGLMLVGDAARQVDPLTGGGIANAMAAGQMAARIAVEAIVCGDTSAGFLARYEEQWQATAGRKLQRNYRLREKFPPARRADERFVHAFALAAK